MSPTNRTAVTERPLSGTDKRSAQAPIISPDDRVLVTGASGFIGQKVVENLVRRGFREIRCLVRGQPAAILQSLAATTDGTVSIVSGNLLSKDDCRRASAGVALVLHLAAARGEKSFPDAFRNSVVTTRNLLDACGNTGHLRRFVNVSSFSVYIGASRRTRIVDESCAVENNPSRRGEAYCYAKVKQDEIVEEYGRHFDIPYVIVRPGFVYGPGNEPISSRIGISTFGLFLHLGGNNALPFVYIDNCAEAIVLAGLTPDIDREAFNVVDDDLPTSRQFLRLYKRNVKRFPSIYLPHIVSYLLCYLWESYADWSQNQLPPVFNRTVWRAYWKQARYSNDKIKARLGWQQKVTTSAALNSYFTSCRSVLRNA